MKHIIHIIVLAVITVVYISCEKEDYALQRLSAPAQLTASRGDKYGCAVQKRRQICPYRSFGLRQEHAAEDPAGLAAGVSGYLSLIHI